MAVFNVQYQEVVIKKSLKWGENKNKQRLLNNKSVFGGEVTDWNDVRRLEDMALCLRLLLSSFQQINMAPGVNMEK